MKTLCRLDMRRSRILAVVGLAGLLGASAHSQWTVVNLHPDGAVASFAEGVADGQQAGYASSGATDHACLWTGTAAFWVDLNPAGATLSRAWSVSGGQQVGDAFVGGVYRASLWTGTAASWTDLTPAEATESFAKGVGGGQQVGYATVNGVWRASLWTGSAASWADITPAGATWSRALGVSGGQQVGEAFVSGSNHASLWTGTAASWVDLNPAGATGSQAWGVDGGQQVGWATLGGGQHASIWSGTAASWADLHGFLPAEFTSSRARGIWHEGAFTYVVGYGFNGTTARDEALMWVFNGAILPTQYTLVFGSLLSGSLQSLHFSDDDRLVATVDLASEALNPVWIETKGTCPVASPSSLQFVVECLADLDGRGVFLRMFNYTTQQWETVFGGYANAVESTITVNVASNASRFVHPTTREIRGALLFQDGTAETVQPVTIGIDRAMWIVRP